MPRPVVEPNIFGQLSGTVSASLLDQNFSALTSVTNDSAAGWTNAAYDIGTTNQCVVNLTPPAVAYANGFFLSFIAANQNTGATSINVNSLGNIPLNLLDGSALTAQCLLAGWMYTIVFLGGAFRIISPCGGPSVGTIAMTGSGTVFSPGWIGAAGEAVSRTDYAALFAAIGTNYGAGDGSSTFNVPNFVSRFPTYTGPPGGVGGASAVALGIANLPSHTHSASASASAGVNDPGHAHGVSDPGHLHTYSAPFGPPVAGQPAWTSNNPPQWGLSANNNTSSVRTGIGIAGSGTGITVGVSVGVSIGATGSGAAFSIMPPYTGCTFLIKCFPLIS